MFKKGLLLLILINLALNMYSKDREILEIEKFNLPINVKYKECISSVQGVRDPILDELAGISTSGFWHNGIDFAVPSGTYVYASKSGIVTCVYKSIRNGYYRGHPVYGGLIIIKHYDGTISLYAHLSRVDVCEGDVVEQGEFIGRSGGRKGEMGSGVSTGEHLHFAVYIQLDKAINWGDE